MKPPVATAGFKLRTRKQLHNPAVGCTGLLVYPLRHIYPAILTRSNPSTIPQHVLSWPRPTTPAQSGCGSCRRTRNEGETIQHGKGAASVPSHRFGHDARARLGTRDTVPKYRDA